MPALSAPPLPRQGPALLSGGRGAIRVGPGLDPTPPESHLLPAQAPSHQPPSPAKQVGLRMGTDRRQRFSARPKGIPRSM